MKRILKQINSMESALRYFDFEGKEIARGNLTGNVDDADLSPEDRQQGVAIQNIVGE